MDPILTSSVRNKRVKNFLIQQVYLRSYFLLHYLLSSCTLGKQKRLRKHTWKNKKLFDNWILYVCVCAYMSTEWLVQKNTQNIRENCCLSNFRSFCSCFSFLPLSLFMRSSPSFRKFCYGSFYWKMPITLIPIKTHFEFRKTPYINFIVKWHRNLFAFEIDLIWSNRTSWVNFEFMLMT